MTATRMSSQQVAAALGKARARAVYAKGEMTGAERGYRAHLEAQKLVGQVLRYDFEKITLKIGDDTRFTADFVVLLADYTLEFVDCKGSKKNKKTGGTTYWTEPDAAVKIKCAAEQFPYFRFVIVWRDGDTWGRREIG